MDTPRLESAFKPVDPNYVHCISRSQKGRVSEFWSQKTQADLLRTRRLAFIWLLHPANGIKAFKEFLGTGPHPYQQGLCSYGKVSNLYSQQPHSGGPGLKASPGCDFIKTH